MHDVRLAHHLADVAARAALSYFKSAPAVRQKLDGTPVSQADLAVEAALIEVLTAHMPGDAVLSEEAGALAAPAGPPPAGLQRRWILDPIDGTAPFLARSRSWGTHVALEVDGRIEVAVITRPTEQQRWWAVRGHGAWRSPQADPTSTAVALRVSATNVLARARIGGFDPEGSPIRQVIEERATWAQDPLGPIIALLEGRLDAVIASGGQVWDHAPQALLVTEAGGRFSDPAGGTRLDAGGGTYTNGHLRHHIHQLLRG